LQSPVLLQMPVKKRQVIIKEKVIIITPTATPPPTPVKTTLAPFKKFLTEENSKVREKVLTMIKQKYTGDEAIAFDNILKKEAGYNPTSVNEIGACGMGQALPCEKMNCPLDYSDEAIKCQFEWVTQYIKNRYETPALAWKFHLVNNWY